MIPILIATAVTCADIQPLIERARIYEGIDEQSRQEIIEIYQVDFTNAVGLECDWDANE
ncbi:hypothetical protein PRSM4_206 [Prochlorococcus phage P-RSM4]|uniref:Uncharacterized protein n=1 Tax=Prochlorococcus phage P-RSM4 TaxID=444862 RepID=E3SM91_9CAUD|nr:hypothetical protein PRSM4_206 [Prochlorococcus phage P-RSM4]ADO98589.1 hypothetical protein PRSM4_206 [Prochlorococcus phage P-RSM4]